MKKTYYFIAFAFSVIIFSCAPPENPGINWPVIENNPLVMEINFTGPTEIVPFAGLLNNDLFLLKVNTSDNKVDGANTGSAAFMEPETAGLNIKALLFDNFSEGYERAIRFNANPPPIDRSEAARSLMRSASALASATLNSTHDFWVDIEDGKDIPFKQIEATLLAVGNYCKIWAPVGSINESQAQALAAKFDAIYPAAVNILGYEYGGGPGGNLGRDGDSRIQILVYNIGGTTLGYFWGKDYYPDTFTSAWQQPLRSNEAEIFYLNASIAAANPENIYSTMIHEFQHMINFYQKSIKKDLASQTWYNEMLSMMAEDALASIIGLGKTHNGHVIQKRIPYFMYAYDLDTLNTWNGSYSLKYAYGAYLLRNYGGAYLLRELLANNSANEESITAALSAAYPGRGIDFEYTLRRFGETLVYVQPLPRGAMSFDKTVTNTINGRTYTMYAFNIWNDWKGYQLNFEGGSYYSLTRPYLYQATNQADILAKSMTLHNMSNWENVSGNITVTLNRPSNNDVKLYMMRR